MTERHQLETLPGESPAQNTLHFGSIRSVSSTLTGVDRTVRETYSVLSVRAGTQKINLNSPRFRNGNGGCLAFGSLVRGYTFLHYWQKHMYQPRELKTSEYVEWSRGRGTDVWAMFNAAASGDLESAGRFVAANPCAIDYEYEYRKPLHFAVRENRLEVVRFLLDAGTDPAYRSGQSWHQPPLALAQSRGYSQIAELLQCRLAAQYGFDVRSRDMIDAIRGHDSNRVSGLVAGDAEMVHLGDERGNQPIHWAVMTRQIEIIDLLLDAGADINAMRSDGARPLDLTNGDYWFRGWRDVSAGVLRSSDVLIGYLIARGADYDISVAAKIGDTQRVRKLLELDARLANRVPAYSTYYSGLPLRCAAGAGHMETVRALLDAGADPKTSEAIAPRGGALRAAIGGNHYDIARLLLERGADPNEAVESSGNCLWAARSAGSEMSVLVESFGGELGMELCWYAGDAPELTRLLEKDPDAPISDGQFGYAAHEGHRELIELARTYQPDLLSRMPFTGAKTSELARWLLEEGVDANGESWLGVTSLHRFAMDGNVAMAEIAIEFGADTNAVDDEYRLTPLGWAKLFDKPRMAALLAANGGR